MFNAAYFFVALLGLGLLGIVISDFFVLFTKKDPPNSRYVNEIFYENTFKER